MPVLLKKRGSLGASDELVQKVPLDADRVSITVSDSASLSTAQVTASEDPAASDAAWSDIQWTANGASFAGPIGGIKLVASGSVDYNIAATD